MALPDIDALDVTDIANQCAKENNWGATPVSEVIRWYKAYLRCRFNHGYGVDDFFAISRKADQLWHCHILHTQKYTADCNQIFGQYLHHTPAPGMQIGDNPPQADRDEYENECKNYPPHNPGGSYPVPPDITVICY